MRHEGEYLRGRDEIPSPKTNMSPEKGTTLKRHVIGIYNLGIPPPSNEGLYGFPTKNGRILVVTVTGWGVVPRYNYPP